MDNIIEGIHLTPLKIISLEKGNVMHILKESDFSFNNFGEAYFTFVNKGIIKGWKKHTKMTLNLVVPIGKVQFVIFDSRKNSPTYNKFYSITLSQENYYRLTVLPGVWMAFKGLENNNLVLNIANIKHDAKESENVDIDKIDYKW